MPRIGALLPIRYRLMVFLLVTLCIVPAMGCGNDGSDSDSNSIADPDRSFAMGFTTWPYAATISAVGDTYDKIQVHGDMVTHHIDGGVPWPEAYVDQPTYHAAVEGDLNLRLSNTDSGKLIYLAVCPLNTMRNAPADYWGGGTNLPRPSPWDGYAFGDAQLVTAYTNYLLNLIDRFQPDYCNYGIEATEYIIKNPHDAANLFVFLQQVYDNIKLVHPDLPLFISATLQSPQSADAALVQGYASQISACTDLIGVSTYGYVFYGHADGGNPANLPADWLSQAQKLAPGKPIAIAETGWMAEDMVIPAYGLNVPGTPQWQADYVHKLLAEADRLNAVLVAWFCIVDFDTLWTDSLGQDPLAQIWRDTGFYDETLQIRPALLAWDAWLGRPLR